MTITPTGKRPELDQSIIGTSGLLLTGGFVQTDFLNVLNAPRKYRALREMADNDPLIGGFLHAITMLCRQVEWKIVPADDSDAADEAREFVDEVFFKDMSHPWSDFIAEVLTFLPFGFSVFEIVYKVRGGPDEEAPERRSRYDDERVGIRKLAFRSQETIFRWHLQDDGGIEGVEQVPFDRPAVTIPVEKLLLFRTTPGGGNPEGRAITRNAYVAVQRKIAVEAAEGRAAVRSAGVVQLKIPSQYMSAGASDEEKAVFNAYRAMAEKLAQDRQGSAIFPSDRDADGNALFELSYVVADGRRPVDMSAVVERYDSRIATSVLADFLLLGQQSHGSFALSSDKTALFTKSLTGFMLNIADVLNRILLPRLWRLNAFDEALMPTLKPGELESRSLGELGSYVQALSAAGAPLFPDPELESTLRVAAALPEPAPEARPKDVAAAQAQAEIAQQFPPPPRALPAVAGKDKVE